MSYYFSYINLFLLAIGLSSCNYGIMSVNSYDGRTGQSAVEVYSMYYEDYVWLVPGKIGITAIVDHNKKNIPILHECKRSLGLLAPDDLIARGLVTLYFWNCTNENHSFLLERLRYGGEELRYHKEKCDLFARHRARAVLGNFKIPNYGRKLQMNLYSQVNGKSIEIPLNLVRRTLKETWEFYGPKHQLPYPWKELCYLNFFDYDHDL
jgi:hypothetical protein